MAELEDQPGDGLSTGGLTLALALADLGLIDEFERQELSQGAVSLRYRPRSST